MEGKKFICGDFFSAAFCGIEFASRVCKDISLAGNNSTEWYKRISERPSVIADRQAIRDYTKQMKMKKAKL